MHSYDPTRPYQSQIPSMRPAQETPQAFPTYTPIYDSLYSEYRRSFRALPGDRSGEEDLGFTAFGVGAGMGAGMSHHHGHYQGHHQIAPVPQPVQPSHLSTWHNLHTQHNQGRQHVGNHFPAALPPGPRRGY
ncbi:hypothetical protein GCM10010329_69860 [Streptomyces spiroverticillatus]|uniref:Uncharacterized protein n=1 Tax=Streptomyces finlayi TaxID=67296 RepID=A0A918X160_9ACTN|nr:hypothetical protein [Streptomyces finlayi]GHA36736.1 hypothetical protein GCM10010329_69860 [Streptomyces spiroverticillatus]GHD01833.1 hypothetical protein GCM10010334_47930 [Streptomyces finlayi]